MKLCIDCKHYQPKRVLSGGLWFCHELAHYCIRPTVTSPVDGKPILKYTDPLEERGRWCWGEAPSSKCGENATYFEPKEETK